MNSKELETLQELLQKFSNTYHSCNFANTCSGCSYRKDCDVILSAITIVTERKIFIKIEEN